jgi:hypothetical protein
MLPPPPLDLDLPPLEFVVSHHPTGVDVGWPGLNVTDELLPVVHAEKCRGH